MWGFGAALPPTWMVNHCFPLGGVGASSHGPEVEGVQGILEAYRWDACCACCAYLANALSSARDGCRQIKIEQRLVCAVPEF